MTRGVAGRPRKTGMTAAELRHLMRIQTGVEGYGEDGTPIARPTDPIDSPNWTWTGRVFCRMKETNGPVFVDAERYYTAIATVRHLDAAGIRVGQRFIREDGRVYTVTLSPIDADDLGGWTNVMIRQIVA